METVSVCGFYHKGNFGDDAMLASFISLFPDFELITIENDPDKLTDKVIIGGGTIISPDFWFFKIKNHTNKKLLFLNVGLIPSVDNETLLKHLKRENCLWIVRDNFSLNILKNLKFNAILANDITIPTFVQKRKVKTKTMSVVCNYYQFSDYFSNTSKNKSKIEYQYNELIDFLKWMQTFGWKINLVPAQISNTIDDRLTNGILKYFIPDANWILSDSVTDTLLSSELIISSRYHFTLFAIANKINLLDLTHHPKNNNFLIDNGFLDNSMDLNSMTKERLVKKIIEIEKNKDLYDIKCDSLLKLSKFQWNVVKEAINNFYETE